MCWRSGGALAGCQEQICRPQSYKDLTVFGYYQNKPLGAILTAPASGTETEERREQSDKAFLPWQKEGTAVALTVTEAATWRTHLRMPLPSNCSHFFFVVFTRAERWRKAHPQPLLNKGPGKLSCEFIRLFFLTAVWGSFLIQQTDCFPIMQAVPWSS